MSARRKARKRAVDILYAAELRQQDPADALADAIAGGIDNPYSQVLVHGVTEHRQRIDELISRYSTSWSLERMPAVDRNVMRVGVFELLYADDVPDPVAVSEAIGLVESLSTDESPAFVNGILGAILRDKAELVGS